MIQQIHNYYVIRHTKFQCNTSLPAQYIASVLELLDHPSYIEITEKFDTFPRLFFVKIIMFKPMLRFSCNRYDIFGPNFKYIWNCDTSNIVTLFRERLWTYPEMSKHFHVKFKRVMTFQTLDVKMCQKVFSLLVSICCTKHVVKDIFYTLKVLK